MLADILAQRSRTAFLLAVIFVALVALSAYGLFANHLFQLSIWTPPGLARFFRFSLVFFSVSLPLIFAFPRYAARVWVAGALALAGISADPLAVASPALIMFSSYVLGTMLRRNASDDAIDQLLNALTGLCVYGLALEALVRLPLNYPLVYLALFLLPLFFIRTAGLCLRRAWRMISGIPALGTRQKVCMLLLAYAMFAHLLVALKPEVSSDGLAMHLAIPMSVGQHHLFHFDVHQSIWAVMPMRADWYYTAAYLMGGEMAARFINYGFLLMIAALVYASVRRWLVHEWAFAAAAIFVSTPLVQLETGSLFVENALAMLLLGAAVALWVFRQTGRGFLAFFLLCGSALGTKLGAFAFVLPAMALLIFAALRRRQPFVRPLLAGCLLLIVFAAPPYVTALAKTGNPFFPFAPRRFHEQVMRHPLEEITLRFRAPDPWKAPYDLTFHSDRALSGQPGSMGFLFLLLLPLGVVALVWRRNWVVGSALVIGVIDTVLVLRFQPELRYLYPAVPLFAIASAWALHALWQEGRFLRMAAAPVLIAAFLLNAYFLPSSGWYHQTFYMQPFFGATGKDKYLMEHAPERKIVDYLNREHPGATVVFLDDDPIAGLTGRPYAINWHMWDFWKDVLALHAPAELVSLVNSLSAKYFVMPRGQPPPQMFEFVRRFRDDYLDPNYCFGNACAASLKPKYVGITDLAEILRIQRLDQKFGPGEYDDTDLLDFLSGTWITDHFPRAFHGTVTFSDHPNAELRLRFEGSEVVYVVARAPNRGIAEIQIDDAPPNTVSFYSPTIEWQYQFPIAAPAPGLHTLRIRVTGQKEHAATGTYVDLDKLIVR